MSAASIQLKARFQVSETVGHKGKVERAEGRVRLLPQPTFTGLELRNPGFEKKARSQVDSLSLGRISASLEFWGNGEK